MDFTTTGPIGDTIGGLMSPFIALTGVLLTFLAFYMQIKANQIQIIQFKKGLAKEKERRTFDEKIDCYNKLSLLKVDLESITKDVRQKSKSLKEYYENEKSFPYNGNILFRTPSKNYTRILEIDRLSIYKAFNMFLGHREKWIKDFSNLYNVLEFLPEFFSNIYQKYDDHSKDQFAKKIEIRNGLIKLMDELANFINLYLAENSRQNYLTFEPSKLVNKTIFNYYKILEDSYDEDLNSVKETDFIEIDNKVLKYFIEGVIKLRSYEQLYDVRLEPIVELISNLRIQISDVKQRALEFAKNVELQYNHLNVSNGDEKSYIAIVNEIHLTIEEELKKVIIDEE
ncbi:hypothetical protein B4N84_11980 [Flavobacterium sp. IR1]|nr:hypothetical protein B4N84_11980 [Flavobacterium sp. IR1]